MATTGSLSKTTTTRAAGIRVDKGIEPGDDHVRVHYRIVSEREDAAAVRIEESLGSGFPMDALDLDSGAGAGDWLHESGNARIALVDIVAAGNEVTTGYVVRESDPARLESVFDAPAIDMVDPLESDGAPETGSGADGTAADADVAAAVDPTASDTPPVDASAVADAIDPGDVAAALDADAIAAALDADAIAAACDPEALAAHVDANAIVGELDPAEIVDALDDAQRDALQDAVAPEHTRSDELEFKQLRARLEDFAAYADGLEELIDEHGTATAIVDDLRADIDAAAEAVDDIDQRLAAASDGHASPAARFDAIEDRLETVTDRLETLGDRLDTHDAHLERVEDRHERLDARIGTVDGRVDGVADDLAATRASVQTFRGTCEESLTDLAQHVSDLERDVAEVDRWRDQVGQAFSATNSEARAPDSIFRAEDDDGTNGDAGTETDGGAETDGDAVASGSIEGDGDSGTGDGNAVASGSAESDGDSGDGDAEGDTVQASPAASATRDDGSYEIDGLDANADSTGAD
jgi:archaellum component FlaC